MTEPNAPEVQAVIEYKGWIAVDLDGTLARYDGWVNALTIGEPIPVMVERVKRWLKDGNDVRIFTARVDGGTVAEGAGVDPEIVQKYRDIEAIRTLIQDWTEKHIGVRLPVTNRKDYGMIQLWDDRCVQVEINTGILAIEADHAALAERLAAAEAMTKRWKVAVEGLTPSGSEFVNDPEYCAAYIRKRCEYPKMIIDLRAERDDLKARNVRLHDLVRYKRMELHTDELITNDEYAELAKDHPAVARLEGYDAMRNKLAAAEAKLEPQESVLPGVAHPSWEKSGDFTDTEFPQANQTAVTRPAEGADIGRTESAPVASPVQREE